MERTNPQEINWLVVSGFAEVRNNTIKYTPRIQKNEQGEDKVLFSYVKSNMVFENGSIEFDVKVNEKNALCQLVLNVESGPDLNIGLNTSGYLFGMTKFNRKNNRWELIAGVGEPETLDLGKTYKLKISVSGSIISLFVNEILVVSASENIRKGQVQFGFLSSEEITLKNVNIEPLKPKAFIVMQFTAEYNELYTEVIKPVCESYGLEVERADEFYTSTPIIKDIVKSITNASVIIAEITPDNPNVFYEVGYAHAIEKPTILLSDKTREKLPFDISGFRTLFYENTIGGKAKVEKNLKKYLENIFLIS